MLDQITPLDDLELQIELLYCQYGWDIPRIAATLQLQKSVVTVAIESRNLVKRDTEPEDTITVMGRQQEANLTLVNLKADEVIKQQHLAPLLATIEITLLQKVLNASLAAKDPDTLSTIINSYKKLTQNAVINTIVQDETKSSAPSVMVNVVNKFD